MRFLAIVITAVGLGSCATLDQEECLAGNWSEIGFVDGVEGTPMSRLGRHADACAKYGVVPDLPSYAAGRDRGLRSYCTVEIGFYEGRTGDDYEGVCPPQLEPDFLLGFADGELVRAVDQMVSFARGDHMRALERVRDLTGEMEAEENLLADDSLNDEERESIRTRIHRLQDDRDHAYADIRWAEREEDRAEREMMDLRARFVSFYGPW